VPDLAALAAAIEGNVITPGSPGYEAVRKPAMVRFENIRPAAIVLAATQADVAEAIAFARHFGLEIATRSGGHSVAGRSSTKGLLIDVTPMHSVSVAGGVATVGAGNRLGALYDALEEHGVTIPAGCGSSVGIAGLTLGGGIGMLGRKYGLTSDRLLGAEVVLADGRIVRCDEDAEEELFWALRGAGGGNFGVVTSLVFRTVPAPPTTVFHLAWHAELLDDLVLRRPSPPAHDPTERPDRHCGGRPAVQAAASWVRASRAVVKIVVKTSTRRIAAAAFTAILTTRSIRS